ncbi:peroxisomal biogenesis factor 3 [Anthonomus grandis grandis]|uniref:peroxisomal biogenesis factor 3 n=1 Tax=Anthonomus grandis grandis TaxID=2921223 RepID=UPI002166690C|nr:peroxisomal biogenesis factor 3 [Anthonomus grandis grandis]
MPVFSKIKDFLSRHRNKFVVGGIIITGSYFLTRYATHRLREWHEKEALEFIERNRKQIHFESINRTCNQTIINLSSSLLDKIYETINTDKIIEALKTNPDNKIELWNDLKVQVFTKAGCIVYCLVMLVITLKLQLNIVGGYLYKDPTSVAADMQEKYLSLCQEFLNSGVEQIYHIMEVQVKKLLKNIDLKKEMKLSDLEAIFWSLQSSLDASKEDPVSHLKSYILERDPPEGEDVYNSMLRDTADLLESEEVKYLVIHHINTAFVLLGDQLSEFFNQTQPKITEVSLKSQEGPDQFQNPFMNKKPLAKLVPILNGLLSKQSLPHNLTHHLITNEKLQMLCANVYESLLA